MTIDYIPQELTEGTAVATAQPTDTNDMTSDITIPPQPTDTNDMTSDITIPPLSTDTNDMTSDITPQAAQNSNECAQSDHIDELFVQDPKSKHFKVREKVDANYRANAEK